MALSSDGNTALIGGNADNTDVGAAWVFTRSGATWTQQGEAHRQRRAGEGRFGFSVALSSDGNTALIGGDGDNFGAGAAWVFVSASTVTGVSPNNGPEGGGTSVTIAGTSFTGATEVKFGSTNAASFKVDSATSITATSPAGAGTVDVTVTTPGGTSATGSADHFSYVPAPTVTGVSPNSGPEGGGTSVTISGTNFTGATEVKFGSTNAASFKVDSATSITATSPAITTTGPSLAGTVDVTVTTSGGTSATGSADRFRYACTPGYVLLGGKCVPATQAAFEWSLPKDLHLDGHGAVYGAPGPSGRPEPDPESGFLTVNGCTSKGDQGQPITSYYWTVTDATHTWHPPGSCAFSNIRLLTPTWTTWKITLTVTAQDGTTSTLTRMAKFRDLLIASLGDSAASGEGDPNAPVNGSVPAEWSPPASGPNSGARCDRSGKAASARAAYEIQSGAGAPPGTQTSVHFWPMACSGAQISDYGYNTTLSLPTYAAGPIMLVSSFEASGIRTWPFYQDAFDEWRQQRVASRQRATGCHRGHHVCDIPPG